MHQHKYRQSRYRGRFFEYRCFRCKKPTSNPRWPFWKAV